MRVVFLISLIFFSHLATANEKVLFITSFHSNKAKIALLKEKAATYDIKIEHRRESSLAKISNLAALLNQYDLVVLDAASARESKKLYQKYATALAGVETKLLATHWLKAEQLRLGITKQQASLLNQYYVNGGPKNFSRMVDFLRFKIFSTNNINVARPIIYPAQGFYHPDYEDTVLISLDEYLSFRQQADPQQAVAVIMMSRQEIESAQTSLIDATIKKLEQKGVLAVPLFFKISPIAADYTRMLQHKGKSLVDLIINFRTIHWANQRKQEFEKLDVPVLQALINFDGNQKQWEESTQGISPAMTAFTLVLPETAGVVDPLIVAAVDEKDGQAKVIDYQLDYMVDKALNVIALRKTPNREKKLTVMVWGDRDVGASFMNVAESLRSISYHLHHHQYAVDAVDNEFFTERVDRILSPFYRDYELNALLEDDLAELMPVASYLQWFNRLPEAVTKPIVDYWGEAKDNFMVVDRDGQQQFVIPRIRNGNMLVMRQPPRADDKDEDKRIYHTGTVPMNHYYLAVYYYARKFWNSAAIVHLGTHGSQEYLAGKERGLSRFDESNLAVGDTPIIYPYIVDDVGEAMQSKRRGSATIISHMTPPFAAAGLQGDLADLHELMHQYKALDQGGVKQKTGEQIIAQCIDINICTDLGWEAARINQDFDSFLESLHDYMEELARQNQPLGLHSFGELSDQPLLISTVVQMLGGDFVEQATKFEAKYYAHRRNHSHDDQGGHSHDHELAHPDSDDLHQHFVGEGLEVLPGFKTVRDFVIRNKKTPSSMGKELRAHIKSAQVHYRNISGIRELESLTDALAGRYISVKTGGDPIRHPESLPTGFNLYGFDPSRLPTKAAYEQGKELVEQLIADYYQKHGHYPDKLAFSLWSIEAMRHYGVLESQAMHAMGVKPVWSDDGRVVSTEIIPASELKRPRVDVVLSATGLYRDAFPNVLLRLAGAIRQVTELKEANNSLWDNSQRIQKELIAAGIEEKEAVYLSSVRIFSSASGQYGSGVDDATFASDTWETDAKIANNYLSKMGYFFGSDNSRWGEQIENLDLYGKQLSGTDVALFARSSNIYGMLSTDDPFEYFGALSLAVRNLDGKSPEMLISNLRDSNNTRLETTASFLAKELRTRMFHKRWIQEMQKEGYSGAVAMAARLDNFWGWQVVDPGTVRADQWQEFYEVYIEDKLELKLDEWFEAVNPKSQANMTERMLEAVRKDYWQAPDEVQQELMERYAELINKYDLIVNNEKLREFIESKAVGYGLDLALPAPLDTNAGAQQVEGRQLNKVEQQVSEWRWNPELVLSLLIALLLVASGAWRQSQRRVLIQ